MRESIFSEHPAMYGSNWVERPSASVLDWDKYEVKTRAGHGRTNNTRGVATLVN